MYIRVYPHWADPNYAYILVRVVLSCTVFAMYKKIPMILLDLLVPCICILLMCYFFSFGLQSILAAVVPFLVLKDGRGVVYLYTHCPSVSIWSSNPFWC